MKSFGVKDDHIWFSIEFPEAENDMVEFDDMVYLKVFRGITGQTGESHIALSPVVVGHAGAYLTLYISDFSESAHTLIIQDLCFIMWGLVFDCRIIFGRVVGIFRHHSCYNMHYESVMLIFI